MIRLLSPLWGLFNLWMLYDCARRGAAFYWYLIILIPGGEVVYFFAVKMRDPELRGVRERLTKLAALGPDVTELRRRVEESPSANNKLSLAQGLYDDDVFEESADLFEEVLAHDVRSRDALYGLGLCCLRLGRVERAAEALENLVDHHPAHADYDGWARLAVAYDKLGRQDDALDALHTLNRQAPRAGHALLYAQRLAQYGQPGQARKVLETAVVEHEEAPPYVRRRDADAAREARRRLAKMG